jgi:hypothetical protein
LADLPANAAFGAELGYGILAATGGQGYGSYILEVLHYCVTNAHACAASDNCGGWLGDLACAVLGDIAGGPVDDINIVVNEGMECTFTPGVCSPQNFAGAAPLCPSSCSNVTKILSVVPGSAAVKAGKPTVHWGQQGKHILGHPGYTQGKSVVTEDPQRLLNDYAGTGVMLPSGREYVRTNETIGIWTDQAGHVGLTTNFTIHYRQDGGEAHLVPSRPTP